jgi:hypothetical protein
MRNAMQNNPQKMVTRYALILFSVLLIAIIYTYFSARNAIVPLTSTGNGTSAFKPTAKVQVKTASFEETIPEKNTTIRQSLTMKADDYKVPLKQQKLTELLPEELKRNIKASLLTPEQLKELSPEERFRYKQTQKKLAKVLREIGKTEAENQKLNGYLTHVEAKQQFE